MIESAFCARLGRLRIWVDKRGLVAKFGRRTLWPGGLRGPRSEWGFACHSAPSIASRTGHAYAACWALVEVNRGPLFDRIPVHGLRVTVGELRNLHEVARILWRTRAAGDTTHGRECVMVTDAEGHAQPVQIEHRTLLGVALHLWRWRR